MTVTFTLSVLQVNNNLINKYKIQINNNKKNNKNEDIYVQ